MISARSKTPMKKLSGYVVFSALLLLAACSASQPAWIGRDVSDCSVSIQRTTCFGTCPVYVMTILGNGKVEFEGGRFVESVGNHTTEIPVDSVRALIHQIDTCGWFELKDAYKEYSMTDAPGVRTVVTIGKRTKTIEHYTGDMTAPAILKIIERRIDEIGKAATFIGSGTPKPSQN